MSDILERLADTIDARKGGDADASYVSRLLARGEDAILKKIGEEATETVMAAKDGDRRLYRFSQSFEYVDHSLLSLNTGAMPPVISP